MCVNVCKNRLYSGCMLFCFLAPQINLSEQFLLLMWHKEKRSEDINREKLLCVSDLKTAQFLSLT